MSMSAASTSPAFANLMIGTLRPSSKTWLASAVRPRPPTSTTWLVDANNAIGWPARNAGVTSVKSCRCPVPCHGSLVMNTSPSAISSRGNALRKWPTERAIELTCPGVPVTACASMRPAVSNTPADRSPASRVEVLNPVRIRAWACSSTTAIKRSQIICSSIAESGLRLFMAGACLSRLLASRLYSLAD